MNAVLESDLQTLCDRCGRECGDGFVERSTGQREADTGYQDYETVCSRCNAEEHDLCMNCFRDDATCEVGDVRLCDGCADDADMADDIQEGD